VNQANTTTTLSGPATPPVSGQPATFTATVTAKAPGSGTPTGYVTFMDGTAVLGTGSLSGGVAVLTVSNLTAGMHTLTGVYSGDTNYITSTSAGLAQAVNTANTTTALSSSNLNTVFSQPITFTATVGADAPSTATPAGTVTFTDSVSGTLGTVTLAGGVASITTSALSVGSHTITATYNGSTNFTTSNKSLTQVVNQDGTTTFVTTSGSPSVLGQLVIFTVAVAAQAPGSGTPTGTVTISDSVSGTLGIVTLAGGVAALPISTLTVASHTITAMYSGSGNFTMSSATVAQQVNAAGTTSQSVNGTPTPPVSSSLIAVGADAGGGPEVKVYDAVTGALRFDFFAYSPTFLGGVRVAIGDVNGDGIPDIITAAGPGGGPHVKVFSGKDGTQLASFFAYDPGFTRGVNVATGDINADGFADIITGAGAGGGPHVKVFSGRDASQLASFYAYDPGFSGGVNVGAGDVNGDGFADIITGAGAGGGPNVKVFDGVTGNTLSSFFAYDPAFTGGVNVGSTTLSNGKAVIITGAGAGGGPNVKVFDGSTLALLASFFAFDQNFTGGVRVAGVNVNGRGEIIAGAGPTGAPQVSVFDAQTQATLSSFFAFNTNFTGGVFVG
jgi:hypothetical protein